MSQEELVLLKKALEDAEYTEYDAIERNKPKLIKTAKARADKAFFKFLKAGNQYIAEHGDSKEANKTVLAML